MTNTLRFRLALWHVVFFAVLLVGFSAFVYNLLARSLTARLDDKLRSQADTAAALLTDEIKETGGDLAASASETVAEMRLGAAAIAIYADGKLLSGEAPQTGRRAVRPVTVDGRALEVVSSDSAEAVEASLRTLRGVLIVGLPLFLLLAGAGGYWVTTRKLAPLESMTAQSRTIGGRNLHARLQIGDAAEELTVLAASFNDLLGRLDQSFESMRRFVADASHELRTPLSVIRAEADLALSKDRPAASYRDSLALILDESRRLSRLIDDLLNLARADAGAVQLRIDEFYFDDLVRECCRSMEVAAATHGVHVDCRPTGDVPFSGDEELLRRLILNLLDNAVRYTPAGGVVTVSLDAEPSGVRLRVEDTGPGIPPDAAPHVFERFFRADKARSRDQGGFGLGLSIVKWIAECHRGAVALESRPEAGSTFTVTLPR